MKKFIADDAYSRDEISSLFQLFFYVEDLNDVPAAESFSDLVTPTFYAPNVSWVVQRNGNSPENGMMISKNASLGNHSHTNGISLELYAKGMIFAPDCAAGVSYWTKDHHEYYAKFPAHNTVVVDGKSDYGSMRTYQAFEVNSIYPESEKETIAIVDYKDYKPSGRTSHKFIRRNHVEPWLGWSANNRLEFTWNKIIRGAKGKKPFKVEKKKAAHLYGQLFISRGFC